MEKIILRKIKSPTGKKNHPEKNYPKKWVGDFNWWKKKSSKKIILRKIKSPPGKKNHPGKNHPKKWVGKNARKKKNHPRALVRFLGRRLPHKKA